MNHRKIVNLVRKLTRRRKVYSRFYSGLEPGSRLYG